MIASFSSRTARTLTATTITTATATATTRLFASWGALKVGLTLKVCGDIGKFGVVGWRDGCFCLRGILVCWEECDGCDGRGESGGNV